MARKKDAERPHGLGCRCYADRASSLAIIVLSLLMLAFSSCARGGGTPVYQPGQEAGVPSATASATAADTGVEAAGPACGNGRIDIELSELCDGRDLGQATCSMLWGGGAEGQLSCNPDCTLNDSMCYWVTTTAGSGTESPATAGSYGGEGV